MKIQVWVILFASMILFGQCDVDVSKCSLEKFTLSDAEHIINEIKEPFRVREVQGKILNDVGEWPTDYPGYSAEPNCFEIQKMGIGTSFIEIVSNCPSGWKMSPVESMKWIVEESLPYFPIGVFKEPGK